jgi:hypothetical protein
MADNVEDYISYLMGIPEYEIIEYIIGDETIMLFVERMTAAQMEIPKTVFGRDVVISKSL